MPSSWQLKRLTQDKLDKCSCQIAYLLEQGWIIPSRASHAASVVFAKKADSSWCFSQDYCCLNAITCLSVEQLPHINQLMDETRGAKLFTKMDLQDAYHQFHIATGDQWKTAFCVQGGQNKFKVGAFSLHSMSSLL